MSPKENAREIKSCGCYHTIWEDDRERPFSVYITEKTTYYKCVEHWVEHQQEKVREKQRRKEREEKERKERLEREEKQRKEKAEREEKWKIEYETGKRKIEKRQRKVLRFFKDLKLTKLREVVQLCREKGWECKMHRGYVDVLICKNVSTSSIGKYEDFEMTFKYEQKGRKYVFHLE